MTANEAAGRYASSDLEREQPRRLSRGGAKLIADPANDVLFSTISIAEVATKWALGRPDFQVEPRDFRHLLLNNGFEELPFVGDHASPLGDLPPIHRDPFDRMLIAQAMAEGITLLTSDKTVARYAGPVRLV